MTNEYREIRDRRVEQFTRYLELMRKRQRGTTSGPSFIIFAERSSGNSSHELALRKSRVSARRAALRLGKGDELGDPSSDLAGNGTDGAFQDWREDDSNRFVQFSFNPKYFDIDLPNTTLWPAEAAEILERRLGFFYVKDRRQFEHPAENVPDFNPLRRVYVYGDERTAAEDMAFVWFDVWKFPVDWRFYVKASAFHEDTDWEDDHPLDVDTVVPAGRNLADG